MILRLNKLGVYDVVYGSFQKPAADEKVDGNNLTSKQSDDTETPSQPLSALETWEETDGYARQFIYGTLPGDL